ADIETNFVMARTNLPIDSSEYKKRETTANYFAADLLMPVEKFLEVVNLYDDIHDVASFFGVSCSAASIRASQLGKFFI
ncbi:MAG: ImmA/IrrE family metallo-endopeptidase, partial [Candidatus Gastranaerophilales bacterium]|nr:ImmA/IrrE family metallo-endopeptidase [Candidatus Gastranaerophilales bacterium]